MYSYKGGAGRTVATANVAAVLTAELQKQVTCIDLDIDSAGLAVVLGVERRMHLAVDGCPVEGRRCAHGSPARRCLQDVLKRDAFVSDKEFKEWWPTLCFDVGQERGLEPDQLLFVPSRAAHHDSVEWRTLKQLGGPIDDLLTQVDLNTDHPPDFVLLDSASGLTDATAVGLSAADCVVVFMRWNRQFVEGTIDAVHFFLSRGAARAPNDIAPSNGAGLDHIENIIIVPTAVPAIDVGEQMLLDLFRTNEARLLVELGIGQRPGVELLPPIPESKLLKWDERILSFDGVDTDTELATLDGYRTLAGRLLSLNEKAGATAEP